LRRISRRNGFPLLFHVTSTGNAENILANGFRDEITKRGPRIEGGDYRSGVWLSNRPLDLNDGVMGDSVLTVHFKVPSNELRKYEWSEDGRGYREWLIPAAFISEFATVELSDVTPR
jgi:hypothetical protein